MHLCAHQSGSPHCHPHKQQFYTGRVFKLLKSLSTCSAIMSFLLEVFVLWRSLCVCVCVSRREAFSLRSRWLWAILCRVFQSAETHARTFWWVGQSLQLYHWAECLFLKGRGISVLQIYLFITCHRIAWCVCAYTIAAWTTSPNWLTVISWADVHLRVRKLLHGFTRCNTGWMLITQIIYLFKWLWKYISDTSEIFS